MAAGFIATKHGSLITGFYAGAATGIADATLGWAISWIIRRGKLAVHATNSFVIRLTGTTVIAIAAVSGFLGGIIAKAAFRSHRRTA